MHDDKSTGRGEPEGQHPKTSKTGDTRDRLGQKNIFPGASNSKILIAFESVSTPWRKEPASVGPVAVVGNGGEKKRRAEGVVGGGLDASVTSGILMVDGTRRSMGPLANWTFLGDKVPVHK